MDYMTLKLIHILSSTILFGTGLGTAFYMWRAQLSGDLSTFRIVAKNVVLADWIFTTPAVVIQPLTGIGMMYLAGFSWQQPWLYWSICLFILVGACWLPVVFIQIKVAKLLESDQPDLQGIKRLMFCWYSLGVPAFLGVIGIFYLMVSKAA
ncbi:DUF2269 family protein [Neptuniibacter sp. QD72_48]|uniref:DUF2269 family protein n=1 Tax=unclassified Neptuniibacter TaxID=2630693 RepID=UPI0039F452B4